MWRMRSAADGSPGIGPMVGRPSWPGAGSIGGTRVPGGAMRSWSNVSARATLAPMAPNAAAPAPYLRRSLRESSLSMLATRIVSTCGPRMFGVVRLLWRVDRNGSPRVVRRRMYVHPLDTRRPLGNSPRRMSGTPRSDGRDGRISSPRRGGEGDRLRWPVGNGDVFSAAGGETAHDRGDRGLDEGWRSSPPHGCAPRGLLLGGRATSARKVRSSRASGRHSHC